MTDERTKAALRELVKATGGETVIKTATLAGMQKIESEKQRKLSELHDKMIGGGQQMPGHVHPELSPSYMNSKYGKNWR
jgi:hypothetical protein